MPAALHGGASHPSRRDRGGPTGAADHECSDTMQQPKMPTETRTLTWQSPVPLFLTVPVALGLYWAMRTGLELDPTAILNGVIIGASVLGTICSLDWAFQGEE